MLKKILIGFASVVVILGLAMGAVMLDMPPKRLFSGKVMDFIAPMITSNMFVSEDTDDFSPGLAIGAQLSALPRPGDQSDRSIYRRSRGSLRCSAFSGLVTLL